MSKHRHSERVEEARKLKAEGWIALPDVFDINAITPEDERAQEATTLSNKGLEHLERQGRIRSTVM